MPTTQQQMTFSADVSKFFAKPLPTVTGYSGAPQSRNTTIKNEGMQLPSTFRGILQVLAQCAQPFPVSYWPYEGRSLYAHTLPEVAATTGIAGIKAKGVGGIVHSRIRLSDTTDRVYELRRPQPTTAYTMYREPHLSLDGNFNPGIIVGKLKGLNSLTLAQAEREFSAHRILSKVGLALPPIMYGEHFVDRQPEKDLNGETTGYVMTASNPRFKMLGQIISFSMVPEKADFSSEQVTFIGTKGKTDLVALTCEHNSFMCAVGSLKRKAVEATGLIRHVGHYDNLLFDPDEQKLYLSDLDSVLFLDQKSDFHPEVARHSGAALVIRDIANDTLRTVTTFTKGVFSKVYFDMVQAHIKTNPFTPYLLGYFAEDVDPIKIIEAGTRLFNKYTMYVGKYFDEFHAQWHPNAVATLNRESAEGNSNVNWKCLHSTFIGEVLMEVATLYKQSTLQNKYPMPVNSDTYLYEQFKQASKLWTQSFDTQGREFSALRDKHFGKIQIA